MNLRITSDNLDIYRKRFAIDKQGVLLMKNCLIWFRNDLRLTDNQTVNLCLANNYRILPVYIIDESMPIGSSSRWWLKKSLESLNKSMSGNLVIKKGEPKTILKQLIDSHDISNVCWNARYSKQELSQDNEIEEYLIKHGLTVNVYHSSLLRDPSKTLKKDGTPFKVYTPFYKQKYSEFKYESHNYDIRKLHYLQTKENKDSKSVIDATVPEENWHQKLDGIWEPGEKGADTRLDTFLSSGLPGYAEDRNRPDLPKTSMLSPHIRFGEISIRQIAESIQDDDSHDSEIFYKELVWREFSYHLLFHFPHLTHDNLQKKFDSFEWENKQKNIKSWQKGLTGYPIVDAGMRQLWQTGYMHNRVRMIVGSFLVKNLLTHWRYGQEWFWDTLVDADIASNSASWQWVAGTGADAAPYFRIFNPVTQSKKFDPDGDYIRKYVPELKNIPSKYIHLPADLDEKSLIEYGVKLGSDYPRPIVDLSATRQRALDAFQKLPKST